MDNKQAERLYIGKGEIERIAITQWLKGIFDKALFYLKAIGIGIVSSIIPAAIFGYVMGITGAANKLAASLAIIIGFFTTLLVRMTMKSDSAKLTILAGSLSTIIGLLIGIYVCSGKMEKGVIELLLHSDNGLRLITIGSAIFGIYLGLQFRRKEPQIEFAPKQEAKIEIQLSPSKTKVALEENIKTIATAETKCPVCNKDFLTGEEIYTCPYCKIQHHIECWKYNNGCGVYGCQSNSISG